ncbi:unnamed protein product [Amoebophrya sp. A25]|nr:unnamed protein product [Amoebophrya sp. A25]|eukprot:GSA25T00004412001.1
MLRCTVEVTVGGKKNKAKGSDQGLLVESGGIRVRGCCGNRLFATKNIAFLRLSSANEAATGNSKSVKGASGGAGGSSTTGSGTNLMIQVMQPSATVFGLNGEPFAVRQFAERCSKELRLKVQGLSEAGAPGEKGSDKTTRRRSNTGREPALSSLFLSAAGAKSASSTQTRATAPLEAAEKSSSKRRLSSSLGEKNGKSVDGETNHTSRSGSKRLKSVPTPAPVPATEKDAEAQNLQKVITIEDDADEEPVVVKENLFSLLPDEIIDCIIDFLNGSRGLQIRPVCRWFADIMRERARRLTLNLCDARHIPAERVFDMFAGHKNCQHFYLCHLQHRLDVKEMILRSGDRFGKLRTLCLYGCDTLTSAATAKIFQALPQQNSLERLCLVGCNAVSESAFEKEGTASLHSLKSLELGRADSHRETANAFTDRVLDLLPFSVSLQRVLLLGQSVVSGNGIFSHRSCANLRFLDLRHSGVTSLAGLASLTELEQLSLAYNTQLRPSQVASAFVGDQGEELRRSLQALDLSGLLLPAAFQSDRPPAFPNLRQLSLANCHVMREARVELGAVDPANVVINNNMNVAGNPAPPVQPPAPVQPARPVQQTVGVTLVVENFNYVLASLSTCPALEHLDVGGVKMEAAIDPMFLPRARPESLRLLSGINDDEVGDLRFFDAALQAVPVLTSEEVRSLGGKVPEVEDRSRKPAPFSVQRLSRTVFQTYHQRPWLWWSHATSS